MSFNPNDPYGFLDYGMSDIDDPYNRTDFANYGATRAIEQGVSPRLAVAMQSAESNFNPNALSPKGARGPMQLMPETANDLGVDINDPYDNIDGGVKYMSQLSDKYDGNEALIAAGYNAGPGAVAKYGGVPPYAETQNYVAKVTGQPLPTTPSFSGSSAASALPSPNRRLADLSAAQEEIEGLEGLKREALGSLGKGSNMTGQEALITALTALVPTLIGWGTGGLQGAGMGAMAGAQGAGVGLSGFAAEAKEREAAAKLAYSDAAQSIKDKRGEVKGIRDSIADREERNQELQYTEGNKLERTGKMAKALARGPESPLDAPDKVEIQKYRGAAQAGVNALTAINTKFADKLGQRYLTENGELDWSGIKKSGTALLEGALGAGTETDKFNSEMKGYISTLVKETSGTAASDKEREYLAGIIQGNGILPADIPTVYENIARLVAKQQAQAEGYLDTAIAARGSNPREAVLSTFPKIPKMNQSRQPIADQEGMTHTYPSGNTVIFRNGKWEPQ